MTILERDVLVKATPLMSVQAFMEKHLSPAGVDAVLAKASAEFPGEVARLAERKPIASDRFPVVFVNRLLELTAEKLGNPPEALAHRVGRFAAERSASGILRLAMMILSMPALLRKLAPVWTQLYSHGKMTFESDDNSATIELSEYPVVSAAGCARISGWFEWFSQQAQKSAVVSHTDCRAKGGSGERWYIRW